MVDIKEAPKTRTNGTRGQKAEIARRESPAFPMAWQGGPIDLMRQFAEDIDRFFGNFGREFHWHTPAAFSRGWASPKGGSGMMAVDWAPRIDVLRRDGNLVVRADLPGLSKDDFKVDVTENALIIQGERKHEKTDEHEGYVYNERSHGSFYRAIPLPEGADASKVTAEFRDGVLEVTMPARPRPEPKTRRVEVRDRK